MLYHGSKPLQVLPSDSPTLSGLLKYTMRPVTHMPQHNAGLKQKPHSQPIVHIPEHPGIAPVRSVLTCRCR